MSVRQSDIENPSEIATDGIHIGTFTLPGDPDVFGDVNDVLDNGNIIVHEVGHWLNLFHTYVTSCLHDICCESPPSPHPRLLDTGSKEDVDLMEMETATMLPTRVSASVLCAHER